MTLSWEIDNLFLPVHGSYAPVRVLIRPYCGRRVPPKRSSVASVQFNVEVERRSITIFLFHIMFNPKQKESQLAAENQGPALDKFVKQVHTCELWTMKPQDFDNESASQ